MTAVRSAHLGFRLLASRLGVKNFPVQRVLVERDLPAAMRDGVVLLADRWMPDGRTNAPLLLVRTPYGRGSMLGAVYGRLLAHQGFQVVMQSCRGTAGSGGVFDRPFAAEIEDGHDTIAWLREQAWYPGSFATIGGSYFGYTQLALAAAAPDEHAAAVLSVTPLSTRDITWPDDTFSPGMALTWSAQVADDPAAGARHLLGAKKLAKRMRVAAGSLPLQHTYQVATGKPVPFFERWLAAEDPADPVWLREDLTSALDAIKGSVLVQAGWYDVFHESSLQTYTSLRDRGTDVRLTVGPWTHGQLAFHTMPDTIDFLNEVLLGGLPRGAAQRVRLTSIGSKEDQWIPDWPPPDVPVRTFQLAAGTLEENPIPAEHAPSFTSFTYDPYDPTPQVGGAILEPTGGGAQDNRQLEARSDVVAFDSAPLARDWVLSGAATVRLTFESDRPSTCVFLRLCLVAPDGRSTNVTDRMVQLAADGRPCWQVDASLPAVSAFVPREHRLRLQVSSGAFPRFLPHSGTSDPAGSATTAFPARQTIHHGPAHPGSLSVPLAEAAR